MSDLSKNRFRLILGRGLKKKESVVIKDHIYRMVIVEGRCTMARLSSLGANCSLVDTKV